MENNHDYVDNFPNGELRIDRLIQELVGEVLEADIYLQEAQVEAFDRLPSEIEIRYKLSEGVPPPQSLYLSDAKIRLCIKPLSTRKFLSRLKTAWQVIIGALRPVSDIERMAFCADDDPDRLNVSLRIARSEYGKVSVDYFASDARTQALMDRCDFFN